MLCDIHKNFSVEFHQGVIKLDAKLVGGGENLAAGVCS